MMAACGHLLRKNQTFLLIGNPDIGMLENSRPVKPLHADISIYIYTYTYIHTYNRYMYIFIYTCVGSHCLGYRFQAPGLLQASCHLPSFGHKPAWRSRTLTGVPEALQSFHLRSAMCLPGGVAAALKQTVLMEAIPCGICLLSSGEFSRL